MSPGKSDRNFCNHAHTSTTVDRIGGCGWRRRPGRARIRALAGLTVLFAVVGALLPTAANANATKDPSGSAVAGKRHCAVLLASLGGGAASVNTESRVLARTCTVDGRPPVLAAATLLMTWYKDAHFEGDSYAVYGADGPCDSAGYGISNVGSAWNDRISSFKGWNGCTWFRTYANIDYGGACQVFGDTGIRVVGVGWVGSAWNDRISSLLVTSTGHDCV